MPSFLPDIGGMEVLAAKALPVFANKGYEIIVITAYGSYLDIAPVTFHEEIPVYRFHFKESLGKKDLKLILNIKSQINKILLEFKPDITNINFSDPFSYFHFTSKSSDLAPTILTLHRNIDEFDKSGNTAMGKLLRDSAWVCGVSESVLEGARNDVPEIIDKSSVIYNGLPVPDIAPEPLPFEPPIIICIGRLIYDKGFDIAIRAFSRIKKIFPETKFLFVGDGENKAGLQALAEREGIGGDSEFLGWVDPDQIPEIINRSTIVVMPSRVDEAFPLVVLQAGLMGRPVVGSRAGGIKESIVDGETGLLFELENVSALSKSLEILLSAPDNIIKLGAAAQRVVHDKFGFDRYVNSYDRLFREIAHER